MPAARRSGADLEEGGLSAERGQDQVVLPSIENSDEEVRSLMSAQITEEDIARLVPAFYERVRQDASLGPVFNEAIEDWPHHLEKMMAFWSSVMLTSGRYKGRPMVAHVRHDQAMTPENFERWLLLWSETTAELLPPAAAAAFQERAGRISESLQLGIGYYRDRRAA
jgi:hemoglobin